MLGSKIGTLAGGGNRVVVISSNQSKYNLRTALGNPSLPMSVIVTINSGVEITSDDATVPAFDEGSGWASGTTITIFNNGKIYGMGGAGGSHVQIVIAAGSSVSAPSATNGQAGGVALALRVPTAIDNSAGEIFGGGGGGGMGQSIGEAVPTLYRYASGGTGGGGKGAATSSPGAVPTISDPSSWLASPNPYVTGAQGNSGDFSGAGTGGAGIAIWGQPEISGDGGDGGDWGAAGQDGGPRSSLTDRQVPLTTGGAGGNAVALNGNSITWLGGNDPSRVKGAVS